MQSNKLRKFSRISLSFVLITIFAGIFLVSYSPQIAHYAYADSSLLQTNSGTSPGGPVCGPCSVSVTLPTSVTSGDVVVVAIADSDSSTPTLSVSDNFSTPSTYAQAVSSGDLYIFDATTSTGCASSCTVTVNDSTSGSDYTLSVSVFDVSGVTTTLEQTGTGGGSGSPGTIPTSSSSSVSFIPGAFLLAAIGWTQNGWGLNAGTGFAPSNPTVYASQSGPIWGAEYEQAAPGSSTDFPATLSCGYCSGTFTWGEAAIALQPTSQTTTTSTTQTVTTPSLTTTTTTTTSPTTTTTTTSATVTVPTTKTTTHTSVSTTTTTVTSPTRVPTNNHVKCSPNPDQAGKPTLCTATVTTMNGQAPVGKVKFYSSGGGTFSSVSCTSTATTLSCSVTYIPPASLIGKSTKISAQYYAKPGSDLKNSHGKTTLNVTDPPKKNLLASPSNSAPQSAVESQTTPYSAIGLFSLLLVPASFAIYLIHRRWTLANLFHGRVATKP